ncbi:M20 metallopeptidase family protein [Carboxylicivirga linearis]|uniref:Amidohydrolase n=1 Tax=Carboxylicivirga linearis TaxID=1628157 RepID=A0ABS5JT73_9BACT|nr:M20 family metallopeptidase [Carboxylicivirga linearis]MBS2098000.1 amidohydrolase [Carboxylicivirga linearis]
MKTKIQELTQKYIQDIIAIRRHLHSNPELSFEEHKTSAYIKENLDKMGIPYKDGFVKTGILGRIEGKNPGNRTIALRADMDALPIKESTDLEFTSRNEGVMHACGHDAHTAALLGAAMILNELKTEFEGTILLIFQPAEEVFPGGAKLMMEEGLFSDIEPDLIIGQHVLPNMKTGHVGFKRGMYMASGDEVHLTVKGKGGHAAMPHALTDNVLIASHIIVALQQIVSRIVPAQIPTVLSFGKVIADGATNIIPEKVTIAGTLRTMNEEWRAKIKEKIRDIAQSTAKCMGAECEVDIKDGYPVVHNTEYITEQAIDFSNEYLGKENTELMDIRMTAEDFGYFSQKYPSTFYRFGVAQDETETGSLHTPQFNLNEKSLETAAGLMAYLGFKFMKTHNTEDQ